MLVNISKIESIYFYHYFRQIFRVLILFSDDISRKVEITIYHDKYTVIIRFATNI